MDKHDEGSGANFGRTSPASLEKHPGQNAQEGKLQVTHGVDVENASEKSVAEETGGPEDTTVYPSGMKLALILLGTAIAIFLVALVSSCKSCPCCSLVANQYRIVQLLQPPSLGLPISSTL